MDTTIFWLKILWGLIGIGKGTISSIAIIAYLRMCNEERKIPRKFGDTDRSTDFMLYAFFLIGICSIVIPSPSFVSKDRFETCHLWDVDGGVYFAELPSWEEQVEGYQVCLKTVEYVVPCLSSELIPTDEGTFDFCWESGEGYFKTTWMHKEEVEAQVYDIIYLTYTFYSFWAVILFSAGVFCETRGKNFHK